MSERVKRQCEGFNKQGRPCGIEPAKGARMCYRHGGKARQVAQKARQRALVQDNAPEMRRLRIDSYRGIDDPARALMDLVASKSAEIQFLSHLETTLHTEYGDDVYAWHKAETTENKITGETVKHKAGPHPVITQRRQAEKDLATIASDALRAGVEERRVRLAELQVKAVSDAIHRGINKTTLTTDLRETLLGNIAAELRTLDTTTGGTP